MGSGQPCGTHRALIYGDLASVVSGHGPAKTTPSTWLFCYGAIETFTDGTACLANNKRTTNRRKGTQHKHLVMDI